MAEAGITVKISHIRILTCTYCGFQVIVPDNGLDWDSLICPICGRTEKDDT